MPRKAYDRVEETTTTTGTGPVDLDGATAAHQEFRDVFADGEAVYYAIVHTDQAADEWETGLGEMDKPNNALKRISVDESSEADDSKVAFSTGEKTVICTPLAARVAFVDEDTVLTNRWRAADDTKLGWGGTEGADPTYYGEYDATAGRWHLASSVGDIMRVADGSQVVAFQAIPNVAGSDVVLESRTITAGTGLSGGGDLSADRTLAVDNYASLARLDLGETVTGAWTFDADVTLGMANTDWLVEGDGANLSLRKDATGGETSWRLYSSAGDGSEFTFIGVVSDHGGVGVLNERVQFEWNPNESAFALTSRAFNTGSPRPIHIRPGNANALIARTDQNVAIPNKLKVGGTGAANGSLEIGGAFYVPDGISAPGAVAGLAAIYVDSADGDLKVKFADGTVKTLATDT